MLLLWRSRQQSQTNAHERFTRIPLRSVVKDKTLDRFVDIYLEIYWIWLQNSSIATRTPPHNPIPIVYIMKRTLSGHH